MRKSLMFIFFFERFSPPPSPKPVEAREPAPEIRSSERLRALSARVVSAVEMQKAKPLLHTPTTRFDAIREEKGRQPPRR